MRLARLATETNGKRRQHISLYDRMGSGHANHRHRFEPVELVLGLLALFPGQKFRQGHRVNANYTHGTASGWRTLSCHGVSKHARFWARWQTWSAHQPGDPVEQADMRQVIPGGE